MSDAHRELTKEAIALAVQVACKERDERIAELERELAEALAVLRLMRHHRDSGEPGPIPSDLLNREYALIGDTDAQGGGDE